MKRAAAVIILTLIIFGILVFNVNIHLGRLEPATITVPDDYPSIQHAINAAYVGATIYVKNGIYYEHLWIDKQVSLVGETGNSTIIDGNGTGTVIYISADNVAFSNFTVRNGDIGLRIIGSRHNTLRDNHLCSNDYNFLISGGTPHSIEYFIQDIDTTNLIENKPMYYLINQNNVEIPADAGYVAAVLSSNITVSNLNLTRNGTGVLLVYSTNCLVENVNSYNHYYTGISLLGSNHSVVRNCRVNSNGWRGIVFWHEAAHNNTIHNNTIFKNGWASSAWGNGGVVLISSGGNTIYHNDFVDNRVPAASSNGYSNVWDNGYPSGGNYWSDYGGSDLYSGVHQNETGSDGIGDAAHAIDVNNNDRYPLMAPIGYFPWDVNGDGYVGIDDIVAVAEHFGQDSTHPSWDSKYDINEDNYIGIDDIVAVAEHFGESI